MSFDIKFLTSVCYIHINNNMDYNDIYVRYEGHPDFAPGKLETSGSLEQTIQKLEVVLFTNKGEVLGDPDFGCDLLRYMWQVNISTRTISAVIAQQIQLHVPELVGRYELRLRTYEPYTITNNPYDALVLNFFIDGDSLIFVI